MAFDISLRPGSGFDIDLSPVAGYTLTCYAGTFAPTGYAAVLKRSLLLRVGSGSFSYNAFLAGLLASRALALQKASCSINGLAATLKSLRLINLLSASFLIWSPALSLLHKSYPLIAYKGEFYLAGISAQTRCNRLLTTSPTAFGLTGRESFLAAGRLLSAGLGTYTSVFSAAILKRNPSVSAQKAEFWAEFRDALLFLTTPEKRLEALAGLFGLTGCPAVVKADRISTLNPGTYNITGRQSSLTRLICIKALKEYLNLQGFSTYLVAGRLVGCSAGAFVFTGLAAILRKKTGIWIIIPLGDSVGFYFLTELKIPEVEGVSVSHRGTFNSYAPQTYLGGK